MEFGEHGQRVRNLVLGFELAHLSGEFVDLPMALRKVLERGNCAVAGNTFVVQPVAEAALVVNQWQSFAPVVEKIFDGNNPGSMFDTS